MPSSPKKSADNPECLNCGLLKSTCEMKNGNEWVKNCRKIEGKKHVFSHNPFNLGTPAIPGMKVVSANTDTSHCKLIVNQSENDCKPEGWEERIKRSGWYPHLKTMGERSLAEFLGMINSFLEEERARVERVVEGMKYNNIEPSGCDCGGDTKGVYDAALNDILLALKENK